jgi:hypothetical protein
VKVKPTRVRRRALLHQNPCNLPSQEIVLHITSRKIENRAKYFKRGERRSHEYEGLALAGGSSADGRYIAGYRSVVCLGDFWDLAVGAFVLLKARQPCSGVGRNRIFGLVTASQIASASVALFSWRFIPTRGDADSSGVTAASHGAKATI